MPPRKYPIDSSSPSLGRAKVRCIRPARTTPVLSSTRSARATPVPTPILPPLAPATLASSSQHTTDPDGYIFPMAYRTVHQRKDETYLDEITTEHCEAVCRQALESDVTTSKDPRDVTLVLDTVFGGHKGSYEREVGIGARLRRGVSSSSRSYMALFEQLERERRDTEALSQKLDAMSQRMERLEMLIVAQSQQRSSNNGGSDPSRH